jgi:hypothetical protein
MADRNPRTVIAEVIDDIYGQDGYDVAGLILDALSDDDVRYLCQARMIDDEGDRARLAVRVATLEDGIRRHRDRSLHHGLDCDGSTDEPLWALLDDRKDTT